MIEQKRKELFKEFLTITKKIFISCIATVLTLIYFDIHLSGFVIILSLFAFAGYYYVFAKKYSHDFQNTFFSKLQSDNNFNDLKFEHI